MEYHIFLKTQKKLNKEIKSWCYWFRDPVTKKQVIKTCKGCKTKRAAIEYVDALPKIETCTASILSVAKDMFIPGSMHYERRKQFGKSVKKNTLVEARRFVNYIIKVFGNIKLTELKVSDVLNFLIKQNKSSSWKNQFIAILKEIYVEAQYQGLDVQIPYFQKFKNTKRKADVFTTEEILDLFQLKNFELREVYLLFLLTLTGGLRISEARGFRPCQLLGNGLIVVDGFMDRQNRIRNNYCKTGSEENPRWRVAIIPAKTEDLLIEFIKQEKIAPNDYLFQFNNAPFRIEHLRKKFEQGKIKSGINTAGRKITMHSMRYTYVTRMRGLVDTDTVRKMVGHTNEKMTEYYTRLSLDSAAAALLPYTNFANKFFE